MSFSIKKLQDDILDVLKSKSVVCRELHSKEELRKIGGAGLNNFIQYLGSNDIAPKKMLVEFAVYTVGKTLNTSTKDNMLDTVDKIREAINLTQINSPYLRERSTIALNNSYIDSPDATFVYVTRVSVDVYI